MGIEIERGSGGGNDVGAERVIWEVGRRERKEGRADN